MAYRKLDYELIVNLYRSGYTTKEIGVMLSCSNGTISKILKKMKEPARERGVIVPKLPLSTVFVSTIERGEVMSHMMSMGMSENAVANAFELSNEQVIISIAEYNVEKRFNDGVLKYKKPYIQSLENIL